MTKSATFHRISELSGVDQYVLVDSQARVIRHAMTDPEEMAEMVSTCGRCALAVGRARFRHLIFSRTRRNDFFIFPVGKYYLGVLKEKSVSPTELLERVTEFIKIFLNPEADKHP